MQMGVVKCSLSDWGNFLLYRLQPLWRDSLLCDTTIECKQDIISAHSVVLAASVPRLESYFRAAEKGSYTLVTPDVPVSVWKNILTFVYYGRLEVREDELVATFNFARKVEMYALCSLLGEEIKARGLAAEQQALPRSWETPKKSLNAHKAASGRASRSPNPQAASPRSQSPPALGTVMSHGSQIHSPVGSPNMATQLPTSHNAPTPPSVSTHQTATSLDQTSSVASPDPLPRATKYSPPLITSNMLPGATVVPASGAPGSSLAMSMPRTMPPLMKLPTGPFTSYSVPFVMSTQAGPSVSHDHVIVSPASQAVLSHRPQAPVSTMPSTYPPSTSLPPPAYHPTISMPLAFIPASPMLPSYPPTSMPPPTTQPPPSVTTSSDLSVPRQPTGPATAVTPIAEQSPSGLVPTSTARSDHETSLDIQNPRMEATELDSQAPPSSGAGLDATKPAPGVDVDSDSQGRGASDLDPQGPTLRYECKVCLRTFDRQAALSRHEEECLTRLASNPPSEHASSKDAPSASGPPEQAASQSPPLTSASSGGGKRPRELVSYKSFYTRVNEPSDDGGSVQAHFVCQLCGKQYTVYQALYCHLKKTHAKEVSVAQARPGMPGVAKRPHSKSTSQLLNKNFDCPLCPEKFKSFGQLQSHKNEAHAGSTGTATPAEAAVARPWVAEQQHPVSAAQSPVLPTQPAISQAQPPAIKAQPPTSPTQPPPTTHPLGTKAQSSLSQEHSSARQTHPLASKAQPSTTKAESLAIQKLSRTGQMQASVSQAHSSASQTPPSATKAPPSASDTQASTGQNIGQFRAATSTVPVSSASVSVGATVASVCAASNLYTTPSMAATLSTMTALASMHPGFSASTPGQVYRPAQFSPFVMTPPDVTSGTLAAPYPAILSTLVAMHNNPRSYFPPGYPVANVAPPGHPGSTVQDTINSAIAAGLHVGPSDVVPRFMYRGPTGSILQTQSHERSALLPASSGGRSEDQSSPPKTTASRLHETTSRLMQAKAASSPQQPTANPSLVPAPNALESTGRGKPAQKAVSERERIAGAGGDAERRFSCDKCGVAFKHKMHLGTHLKKHHS